MILQQCLRQLAIHSTVIQFSQEGLRALTELTSTSLERYAFQHLCGRLGVMCEYKEAWQLPIQVRQKYILLFPATNQNQSMSR